MLAFRERWVRFWFEPVDPLNLGLCRILFFGAFFLYYLRYDTSAWGGVPYSLWVPISFFKTLHLPLLSSSLLTMIQSIWKVSLALSCIGILTRVSTLSSFVLGLYLLGVSQNFGKVYHSVGLVVIIMGIMAVSRCGDAVSIDHVIRSVHRGSNPLVQRPRASGEYTWPVRAVWVTFALVFFAAGISKLRHSGLEWVFSDNLAILLTRAHYLQDEVLSWGVDLSRYDWLTRLLAAATIVLETSYPLALFSRRARWVIVPGVFFMQIGIMLLMGVSFKTFLISNLFWVPWDRVVREFVRGFHKLSSLLAHSTSGTKDHPRQ